MDIDERGAPPPGVLFDEAWYLSEYPGVAETVRDGGFRSGWEHYVLHGRAEGRHPVPLTHLAQSVAHGAMPQPSQNAGPPFWEHNGVGFLTPGDFQKSQTDLNRIAAVAPRSLSAGWLFERPMPGCSVGLFSVESITPPPALSASEIALYSFVVVQVSLRELIDDEALHQAPYDDLYAHARVFDRACRLLESYVTIRMRWNFEHGTLTFVTNFFVPQHNPMGRLFPRYDLRNPEYFVSELNRHLETIVRQHRNAYMLDLDRLSASLGRRFVQDDALFPSAYGGVFPVDCADTAWIGPLSALSEHYDIRSVNLFPDIVWAELRAMYRTLCGIDAVQLVVIELVDTLWKARATPGTSTDGPPTDGWPAGITEALIYLRKRGIRLAILSKNDEQLVREIWSGIFGRGLRIEDFAAIRINWRPKPENMSELLQQLDLPPRAVVFVDADPAEREEMRQAFPDMRVSGDLPYYLRRVLLWSSETQVVDERDNWARRLEVMQALAARDTSSAPPTVANDPANCKQSILDGPRRRLEQLWTRALDNDISPEDAKEIQRLGMAIGVTDRGMRRVRPFKDWK
jgi:phosphoglycolate phosphatase-like HAD superfamily hydrolase